MVIAQHTSSYQESNGSTTRFTANYVLSKFSLIQRGEGGRGTFIRKLTFFKVFITESCTFTSTLHCEGVITGEHHVISFSAMTLFLALKTSVSF